MTPANADLPIGRARVKLRHRAVSGTCIPVYRQASPGVSRPGSVAVEATVSGLPIFTSLARVRCRPPSGHFGGGSPKASGTTGPVARNIVRDQRRQIEVALAGGAHDAGQHLLAVGAVAGAVATADLSDNDGGTDGLFGAPVGSRRPTGPTRRETRQRIRWPDAGQSSSVSSSGGGASISRPSWATSRPRTDARPCSLSSPSLQRSRTARPVCKTACAWPASETVRMIFLQFLASSE